MSTIRKRVRNEENTPAIGGKSSQGKHERFFRWFLGMTKKEFFQDYFEKKPMHYSHGLATHFSDPPDGFPPVRWSTDLMLQLTTKETLSYSTDINIVRYDDAQKKRVAYRSEGIVTEKDMRHSMQKGWSVRFLRPHEYIAENSAIIVLLEEIFGCFCGMNSYWTPSNSQGFAPHYDDVDVFLLQLEGEKEWRLYDPPGEVDILSRHSSEDYVPDDLPKPKCSLRLVAGDVLYMPRGTVHQGRTCSTTHSLHVTFSANQMNTWADLMRHAAIHVIEKLAANKLHWRHSIPRSLLTTLGAIYHPEFRAGSGLPPLTEKQKKRRRVLQASFNQLTAELSLNLSKETVVDECCDMYARDNVSKLQPPPSSSSHRTAPISPDSLIHPVAPHCARLVLAVSGEARVYHCCNNSPVCLAKPEELLRFEEDFAPAIATILSAPERGVCVSNLPFPSFDNPDDILENQLTLVETMRDAGILAVL